MIKNLNKAFLLVLSLFLFASCSGKKNKSYIKPADIKFSWWGNAPRAEYTKLGLKIFKNEYPEINVKPEGYVWTGYEEMFESQYKNGTTADVMQINYNWLSKYSPFGDGFYDLSTLADYIDLNNFTSDELEYGTQNGVLNAIPVGFNTIVPMYNQTLLDKYNLKSLSTWDDIMEAGKKLKSSDYYLLGGAEKQTFLFILCCYEQYYDKRVFKSNRLNLNESEVEDLFFIYKRFVDNHVCYPCNRNTDENVKHNKNIIGVICWSNEVSSYGREMNRKNCEYTLGKMPQRLYSKESGLYVKPSMLYAIKKDTKSPEAAALLVDFLLNNEKMAILQESERGVPVSNKSITALLETGHLNSLEYDATMQTRFNASITNKMYPLMEDVKVVSGFSLYANAYNENRISASEAADKFVRIIETLY